jgi:hypothetical protein
MSFFIKNIFLINLNRLFNQNFYSEHLNNYLEDFNFYEIKKFYNNKKFLNYIMLDFDILKKKKINYIFNEYNDFFKNFFMLDENYNFLNYKFYKLFFNEYHYNKTLNFIKKNSIFYKKNILIEIKLVDLNFKGKFFLKFKRCLFDVFEQFNFFIKKFTLKKKGNNKFISFSFNLDINNYNYLYFFDKFKSIFFKI